jgi:hypothetical protein
MDCAATQDAARRRFLLAVSGSKIDGPRDH